MKPDMQSWNADDFRHATPFAPLGAAIEALDVPHWPDCADLNRMLAVRAQAVVTARGKPLRFIEAHGHSASFEGKYEPSVFLRGEVQVRVHNWHDLFNALVWVTFPRAKAALNERHYHELVRNRDSGTLNRGRTQDALTLFDEGGMIVAAADAGLIELLRGFKWKELFWIRRAQIDRLMRFYLFGHAIYEKALQPFPGITAKSVIFEVAQPFLELPLERQLDELDQRLAARLDDQTSFMTTRELSPLPVLGIPGWSADNVRCAYYDNTDYFRSGYRRQAKVRP